MPLGFLRRTASTAYGLTRLASRPVRKSQGGGRIVMRAYRGYGSRTEIFLIGRVFRQIGAPEEDQREDVVRHLRDIARRVSRHAVKGVKVSASFNGAAQEVETDADGYFRIHLTMATPVANGREWHTVPLRIEEPEHVEAKAEVFIPPDRCRYVVISDIDDTIMDTGVAHRMRMLYNLFVAGAEGREAFPGVGAFYRALHDGVGGDEKNPMLYVSRGPWGIYDMLDTFFGLHEIPNGPILFLREWGIRLTSPLPRKAKEHKRQLIDHMLSIYDDLPFILIGDSGQHDPEVYRQVVEEHRHRVLAVYIRNVSRDQTRMEEIDAMARPVVEAGSSLLLASDSPAMAEHAAKHGLIRPECVEAVRTATEGAVPEHETREVRHTGRARTEEAVARGELDEAVESAEDAPNVVVEPKEQRQSGP